MNYSIGAEQNVRVARNSMHASELILAATLAAGNGTTGFGTLQPGTVLGAITSTKKLRPCAKQTISATAAGGNDASVADAGNFFAGDAVDIISKLGVVGTLNLAVDTATIVLEGRNRDGKAHAFVLADPSAAGAALAKTETWSSAGILTTTIHLATTQHAASLVVDGTGKTIVVTGKDGKAHSVQLVDPGAEAPMSQTVDVDPSTGVATIKIYLKNSSAPAITATVNEVVTELNRGQASDFVGAVLGTAVGSETAIAVGATPLAGGGVITSTVGQVVTLLNQGDSGEAVKASATVMDSSVTAVAVASTPLVGGAAAGGTLASNRTVSAVDKAASPNEITFSGGAVDLVEGDIIQVRDGSATAIGLLERGTATLDKDATLAAGAAVYRDVEVAFGVHGIYKLGRVAGYDATMLDDLRGRVLALSGSSNYLLI